MVPSNKHSSQTSDTAETTQRLCGAANIGLTPLPIKRGAKPCADHRSYSPWHLTSICICTVNICHLSIIGDRQLYVHLQLISSETAD